ncbi:MAG: tetratricopeptide repeat protein [Alphaproteobacteria bacterium]|nr:tetratricopeptide repeat protein [Alphaproteobacteria bacterium]
MWWILACSARPPAEPVPERSEACDAAFAPAPGPLAEEALAVADAHELALVRLREARLSGDPGFYTLADLALSCALEERPADPELRALHAHVLTQFHRFAEAEALLAPLAEETGAWRHWMFLGDARLDQGDLEGARAAFERAMQGRPGLEIYDRMADLAWSTGDLDQAIDWERRALSAASPQDPEPMAWVASRLGWYRALAGERPDELGLALTVLPDHPASNLLLGRYLLFDGHPELATAHLRRAGTTIEALRTLHEIDPTVDVAEARLQDRRGWALWIADERPEEALVLLDRELEQRRDALTRVARARVAHQQGADVQAEVADALSVGIQEPLVLLLAAEATDEPSLARRALERPVGLLPSERKRAVRMTEK